MAMAIFMLSPTGVPPPVGFTGKFYVFSTAVEAGYIGLAVIGVLNSAVSAYTWKPCFNTPDEGFFVSAKLRFLQVYSPFLSMKEKTAASKIQGKVSALSHKS